MYVLTVDAPARAFKRRLFRAFLTKSSTTMRTAIPDRLASDTMSTSFSLEAACAGAASAVSDTWLAEVVPALDDAGARFAVINTLEIEILSVGTCTNAV